MSVESAPRVARIARIRVFVLAAMVVAAGQSSAQRGDVIPMPRQDGEPIRAADGSPLTGAFAAQLFDRSAWSDFREIRNRCRINVNVPQYVIEDEVFQVYIPPTYDGTEPYGLMVYIDPGGRGGLPDRWRGVIDEHKLIWIGADTIGNRRELVHRLGLSLDATANMLLHYNIDIKRIYVTGMSGGGRCSSWLAMTYPDVYEGMIAQAAVDFWNQLPVPGRPNTFWPQKFPRLRPGENLIKALRNNRHVMIIGTEDPNYEQTVVTSEKMEQQRFSHVLRIDMPGAGHVPGGTEEFDQAIRFLDAPLLDAAAADDAPRSDAGSDEAAPDWDGPGPVLNADGSIRTGLFEFAFDERSDWSDLEELSRRHEQPWRDGLDYSIVDERCLVRVPPHYDGSRAFGLLVFVPAAYNAALSDEMAAVIDRHDMIWVGLMNAGNDRPFPHRNGMALDAVWNLRRRYNIDQRRIYATGFSGGSRAATWLAMTYPEVFAGFIAQGAVDWWNALPIPDEPGMVWPRKFPRLDAGPMLVKALWENRYVLIIGDDDDNHTQTMVTADKMRSQRIKHLLVIEMAGVGHVPGGPDELDRALTFVDAPVLADAQP